MRSGWPCLECTQVCAQSWFLQERHLLCESACNFVTVVSWTCNSMVAYAHC